LDENRPVVVPDSPEYSITRATAIVLTSRIKQGIVANTEQILPMNQTMMQKKQCYLDQQHSDGKKERLPKGSQHNHGLGHHPSTRKSSQCAHCLSK
jgi:hypothetical protein